MATLQDWTQSAATSDRLIYHLFSDHIGDRVEVTIVPPPVSRDAPAVSTLYVLDPMLTLDTVVGCSHLFARFSSGRLPPPLIVGVGYPTRDLNEFFARRIRDLTPTEADFPTELPIKPPLGTGGAPQMLASLCDEVMPLVERDFPNASSDRTLIGYSLGGLFAFFVLLTRPETFTRYLAVSPSLWWDNTTVFAMEETWARSNSDLPARLYCAVGAMEEEPGGGWRNEGFSDAAIQRVQQVSNFKALTERLQQRKYPNLRLCGEIFPSEHHLTMFPAAVPHGLIQLFDL